MDTQVFVDALPEIVTQLVAFLAVFLILKKYAFGAVLRGIDERQKMISDSFKEIDQKKVAVAELEREYRTRLQDIEHEVRAKIQDGVHEGQRIAQDLRDKARAEAMRESERAKADIDQEVAKARAVIRRQVVELSAKMASKIIRKNLSTREDEALVEDLLREAEKV